MFLRSLQGDSDIVKKIMYRRVKRVRNDISLILQRSISISNYTFNINVFSSEECVREFRFRPSEINEVMKQTGWVAESTKRNRYACNPYTATCILLRRLAYPCRWKDLEFMFGMHASHMSEVFHEVAHSFYNTSGKLVTRFRGNLLKSRSALYANAIVESGGTLTHCVGFIDGTKIKISRPGGPTTNQRSVYSGHKRMHCLSFQTISTPDGLIFHVFGPIEGRQPDAYLYLKSNLEQYLQQYLNNEGVQYYIYGDQAYHMRPWMQVGYPKRNSTPEQRKHNRAMNSARVCVEWSYGEVKNSFATQDFARKMQVMKLPVGLLYVVSILLRNFKTCTGHHPLAVSHFGCLPPSFEEYVSL